jgi:hypothetical protein
MDELRCFPGGCHETRSFVEYFGGNVDVDVPEARGDDDGGGGGIGGAYVGDAVRAVDHGKDVHEQLSVWDRGRIRRRSRHKRQGGIDLRRRRRRR